MNRHLPDAKAGFRKGRGTRDQTANIHWIIKKAGSVQFSCSVMSNSLWPHGLQHARSPCPSPTPRVYSTSCSLSQWSQPTISSSSRRKQAKSRKISTSASLTTLNPSTVWIMTNWKILKEMGVPDHLTCLLWNLNVGKEAAVKAEHGTIDWFKIGKGVKQSCILSPCLYGEYILIYMQSTSYEMLGWMNDKLASRLPAEISITSDMQMIPI